MDTGENESPGLGKLSAYHIFSGLVFLGIAITGIIILILLILGSINSSMINYAAGVTFTLGGGVLSFFVISAWIQIWKNRQQ